MKKNCLIIYNPIAGKASSQSYKDKLIDKINQKEYHLTAVATTHKGHAAELAQQAIEEDFDFCLVIGGDGTINEVASVLAGSKTALAPFAGGSGNGYARSLDLPMRVKPFAALLNSGKTRSVDYGKISGKSFFNVAGHGFDADLAALFNQIKGSRGVLSYIMHIIPQVFKIKTVEVDIFVDDQAIEIKKILWLSMFIGKTYGGPFKVNPRAEMDDGKFELIIFGACPFYYYPIYFTRLILGKSINSRFLKSYSCSKIKIIPKSSSTWHVDGETYISDSAQEVSMVKAGIRVLGN